MSRARNAILARLKKHTKAKKNKAIQLNSFSSQTLNTEQNVILFVEKMKENKAEVHRVNHQNWKDTLAKIAIDKKLNTWLLGNNLNEIVTYLQVNIRIYVKLAAQRKLKEFNNY